MTFKVETPLGDLVPTVEAARLLNANCGDFSNVVRQLSAFDFSTYVAVASAALGKKRNDIEIAVFAAGLSNLIDPFTLFVMSIIHGGIDPKLAAT